jgi:uncharacterized membrane protein YbhN (UPF0104 family)
VIDDPRGLAIAVLALLALALLGASLGRARFGGGKGTRVRIFAGALIMAAAALLARTGWRSRGAVDLSPSLPTLAAVAGEWRDGSDTVTFDGNGYRCRGVKCTGLGPSGQWSRVGPHGVVARWADGHEVTWRIVRYKGELRLALLPLEGDVGSVDGRLFYTKVQ